MMCDKKGCDNTKIKRYVKQVDKSLCQTCVLEFTFYVEENSIKKEEYRKTFIDFLNGKLGNTSIYSDRKDDDDYFIWGPIGAP
jgi:hypothetical protein